MTLTTYLLYVAAVASLILTPGPTMLMCMTNALNHALFAPQFVVFALMGGLLLFTRRHA